MGRPSVVTHPLTCPSSCPSSCPLPRPLVRAVLPPDSGSVRGKPWSWSCGSQSLSCPSPPSNCPPHTHKGTPTDQRGCPGCTTCVFDGGEDAGKAAPVPVCYAGETPPCPHPPICSAGSTRSIQTQAGADGKAPCCPTYACNLDDKSAAPAAGGAGNNCPALTCVAEPSRCPAGSRLELFPKDEQGCPGCPACLDGSGQPVAAPPCWGGPSNCAAPPICDPGFSVVLEALRGDEGQTPCCDT